MKRLRSRGPLPAFLLAGLLTGAGGHTASAQTSLLEVDYQNNPLFHVLSSGKILIPLGAAHGYVLTTDDDGYASWQPVPSSGLTAVISDATLLGDGTAIDPLGVAVPLVLTGNSADGQVRGEHTDGHVGTLGGGHGVLGRNDNDNQGHLGGPAYGAYGLHNSGAFGYFGSSDHGAYGEHSGIFGYLGSSGFGAWGQHNDDTFGYLGGSLNGAGGVHASGNYGTLGSSDYGAYGEHTDGNKGYLGSSDYGAYGENAAGYYGFLGSSGFLVNYGVYGSSPNGNNYGYFAGANYAAYAEFLNGNIGFLASYNAGAYGGHNNGNAGFLGGDDYGAYGGNTNGNYGYLGGQIYGAYGEHDNGHWGFLGGRFSGAYGENFHGNYGVLGGSLNGAYGEHDNGNFGYLGDSAYGVYGRYGSLANYGYLGSSTYGVYGNGSPYAGYFEGDVEVTGTLSKGGGSFKIDHPLDPEGQYLSHSFVESPDMMNLYNGTVTTDAQGFATVTLPDYFEALNRDFRYGLTVIGQFAQAIVAEEIQGNQFVIRTDQPGVKVSWQVTGIRRDPWAEQNRIVVEEVKPAIERGYYLHPGLYGQPEERSIAWARDPEGMRAMQEMPQRMDEERRQIEQERQRMDEERQRMQAQRERVKTEQERMKAERERMEAGRERMQRAQERHPPKPRPDNRP